MVKKMTISESELKLLHQESIKLHSQGKFTEAEEKYKQVLQYILQNNYQNPDIYSDLGSLYYQMGRYQEALENLYDCLKFRPQKAIHYCRLALILEKTDGISPAIKAYQTAINLDPKFIDNYIYLGRILAEAGNTYKAELIYRQAVEIFPNHFYFHYQLGKILSLQRQFDQAIICYTQALKLNQNNWQISWDLGLAFQQKGDKYKTNTYFYFGLAYYQQKNYQEAINWYQTFLAADKNDKNNLGDDIKNQIYIHLIECFKNLNQWDNLINTYREYIKISSNSEQVNFLYSELIENLHRCGRTSEAIATAREACKIFNNNNLYFKRQELLLLPIIYENEAEITDFRNYFSIGLETLIQTTKLDTPEARIAALNILIKTNFYLQYQGQNDLELQKNYGQFVHKIMGGNFPEFIQPIQMPKLNTLINNQITNKIRIGYISTYLCIHTVSRVFIGWLRHCDRQKFEIHSYHLGESIDDATDEFKYHSDYFNHLPAVNGLNLNYIRTVAEKIKSDQLNILVFLDIGMHPLMTIFAGLRLAPVQCMAWGHPVTSGIPTIDYFLSSDIMEPENAEKEYYAEELIRLPNLGIPFSRPNIPEKTIPRSYFQLSDDKVLYLSPQSLFKYLPQYDFIFPEIARLVPNAQFLFMRQINSVKVADKFWQRLHIAFANYGLDIEKYCVFIPQQNLINYWHLNLVADIFLDTFEWTGGLTALDAISCNLPIVTYPGKLMRGRQSYGILKIMGITETIANNINEYIAIAVKLGLNKDWRKSIVDRIKQNQSFLYNDLSTIQALESFYQLQVNNRT